MGRRFAELAFTPKVKEQQELHDSRQQYEHVEQAGRPDSRLGSQEQAFIRHATNSTWLRSVKQGGRTSSIAVGPRDFCTSLMIAF